MQTNLEEFNNQSVEFAKRLKARGIKWEDEKKNLEPINFQAAALNQQSVFPDFLTKQAKNKN